MIFDLKAPLIRIVTSSLFRTSSIYTVTNFINAAIPLLLLPILTSKLTPADYGIVAMFQLAIAVIYPFISLNFEGAISRKYYDKDDANLSSYIGNCFILTTISFVLFSLLLWGGVNYVEKITHIPPYWLKFILIVAISQFVTSTALVIYQVKVKPIKYGILQVSQTLLNVFLTLFLVFTLNRTWEGRLEAQIITTIIVAIVSFTILFKEKVLRFTVNKNHIKQALKFGVPLVPHAIGGMLFTAIDRFFLTNLIGLEQTGNYTIAYQIGMVVSLITIAFNNAFVPWLFEKLNEDSLAMKRKIVKFTYLYFFMIIVGALILMLLFPYLVSIFVNGAFHTINTYSLFIVFGFVFHGMYFMVTNYIFYAKKTHIQGLLTIFVAVMKIPITYFAIIWFGAVGAGISFCLTYFLFFIITWIYSHKVYPMPWNILKLSTSKSL